MPYKPEISLIDKKYLTENLNLLNGTSFKVDINKTITPNLEYFITSANLPGISVAAAMHPTMNRNLKMPGDKIEYMPLELVFLVDENMKNWQEIYDWLLVEVTSKDSIHGDLKHRDLTLTIMNSHNNIGKQIQFVDCFPTELSGLEFNLQNTDVQYLTATVTIEYSYYKIVE